MSSEKTQTPPSSSRVAQAAVDAALGALRNRWFVACVAVLGLLTAGFEIVFRDTAIRKLPLPLKRELDRLDRRALTRKDPATGRTISYRMRGQPYQLDTETLNALGTEQYITWPMQAWDDDAGKPTGEIFELSVTYYTGKPDQVPHVPEQCMRGNGFQEVGNRMVTVNLPGLPQKDRSVPVKVVFFDRQTSHEQRSQMVMYTFRVNDAWAGDRDGVRWLLGDFFAKYAYFSKVEVTLPLRPGLPREDVERGLAAGTRFLETVLPVLVRDHWPDWPTGARDARAAAASVP